MNFINRLLPTETIEAGARAGQMSVNTSLLLLATSGYGLFVRLIRGRPVLSVLSQAINVALLGVVISMLGMIFANLPPPIHWSANPTDTGPLTALSLLLLIFAKLAASTDENGLPLRIVDLAEVAATGAIAGVIVFYGVLSLTAPISLNASNIERIHRHLDATATAATSKFKETINLVGLGPHNDQTHARNDIRVCRADRGTYVFSFELLKNRIHQVDCAYGFDRPSPGGSVYSYFADLHEEQWLSTNPTSSGAILKHCETETRCHLFRSVTSNVQPQNGAIYVLMLDLSIELRDYLRLELVNSDWLADIDFQTWINTLPMGTDYIDAVESFDAHLTETGFASYDFRGNRIKTATIAMTVLLLLSILGVFVMTQISQRTHVQFIEASRQLSIRQFYTRRFVYAAAHDLRAPLRGIEQLSEWARDDLEEGDIEAPNRYLGMINARIQHLSRLIEGILDLARLENRESQIEDLPLSDAINAAANLYRAPNITVLTKFQPAGLRLQYEYDGLVRVLNNLLANAISHHDRETINIAISSSVQIDALEIVVTDDGPGIPEARHEMIFELFRTYSENKEHKGVGMGLAMVRRLVEEWGGTIHAESPVEQGRGARFVIKIPLDLVWKRGV
ncbi:sensor histidine kinase [Donghicola sp. XS_ASV15]|uniref:sensor histidine kinase n=1 Tax=Donghicola sp. XS_ASV15 TaxID=3241295 RepID=UPI003513831E